MFMFLKLIKLKFEFRKTSHLHYISENVEMNYLNLYISHKNNYLASSNNAAFTLDLYFENSNVLVVGAFTKFCCRTYNNRTFSSRGAEVDFTVSEIIATSPLTKTTTKATKI